MKTAVPRPTRRDEQPALGNHTTEAPSGGPVAVPTRASRTPRAARAAERGRCRCGHTWTGLSPAHCSACHKTFAAPGLFDRHRTAHGDHGQCKNPAHIHHQTTGEPLMYYRNGMWRGREMTDAEKLARRRQ